MKSPFVLIQDTISTDTVECCRQLLKAAQSGELIGIAFVGMLKRRGFIVNSAGEAHRNPTFSLGMVACLSDQLTGRARGGNS